MREVDLPIEVVVVVRGACCFELIPAPPFGDELREPGLTARRCSCKRVWRSLRCGRVEADEALCAGC